MRLPFTVLRYRPKYLKVGHVIRVIYWKYQIHMQLTDPVDVTHSSFTEIFNVEKLVSMLIVHRCLHDSTFPLHVAVRYISRLHFALSRWHVLGVVVASVDVGLLDVVVSSTVVVAGSVVVDAIIVVVSSVIFSALTTHNFEDQFQQSA